MNNMIEKKNHKITASNWKKKISENNFKQMSEPKDTSKEMSSL